MTIDELIQKAGGGSLPVQDPSSTKELKKLNRSIQTLIQRVENVEKSSDGEKSATNKLSDRLKNLTQNIFKKPADKIMPAVSKLGPRPAVIKNDADKRIDNLDRKFSMLIDSLSKMQQPAKQKAMASTVDPTSKTKTGGGGMAGSLIGGLLGAGLAASMLTPEQRKKLLDAGIEIGNKLIKSIIDTIFPKIKEEFDKFTSGPIDYIKDNPLVAALAGIAGYKIGKAAIGIGLGAYNLGKRLKGGDADAAPDMEGPDRGNKRKKKITTGKGGKPKARGRLAGIGAAILGTLGGMVGMGGKDEGEETPTGAPGFEGETPEQKKARERATDKAKAEVRSRDVKPGDIKKGKPKPSLGQRLGKLAGRAGRLARGIPVIGLGVSAAYAGYDAATGVMNAEETLGIQGRKATMGEKFAAGLGGLVSGATFGAVDKEKAAKGIAGAIGAGPDKAKADETKMAKTEEKSVKVSQKRSINLNKFRENDPEGFSEYQAYLNKRKKEILEELKNKNPDAVGIALTVMRRKAVDVAEQDAIEKFKEQMKKAGALEERTKIVANGKDQDRVVPKEKVAEAIEKKAGAYESSVSVDGKEVKGKDQSRQVPKEKVAEAIEKKAEINKAMREEGKEGGVRSMQKSMRGNFSEYKFLQNDPENFQKYQDYKNKRYKEYEKEGMEGDAAELRAKTDAAEKFAEQIGAAMAGKIETKTKLSPAQREQQPSQVLSDASAENRELEKTAMAPKSSGGSPVVVNNNSTNNTQLMSAPAANPRGTSNSVETSMLANRGLFRGW